MLFGGTFLGYICPQIIDNIFNNYSEEGKVLNVFYQLGLIFLMFVSGYNTKIDLDRKNTRIFTSLFVGSTIIPMLLGMPFINIFMKYFIGSKNNKIAYSIVFLIAIAITSIPVISKIFFDMGIINTKFANIVLTASTLQDLCLWILLNSSINIATSEKVDYLKMFITVVVTIVLFVITKYIGKLIHRIKIDFRDGAGFLQLCFICLFFFIALQYFKNSVSDVSLVPLYCLTWL